LLILPFFIEKQRSKSVRATLRIQVQEGQIFSSQSKIQEQPSTYQHMGFLPNGRIWLKAFNGNPKDDCEVDPEWFDSRKIVILLKKEV